MMAQDPNSGLAEKAIAARGNRPRPDAKKVDQKADRLAASKARWAQAKQAALDHLETFALELWRADPRYRKRGMWNIADPFRHDAKPSNLALNLTNRRGAFHDFDNITLKGDALDFVAYGLTGRIDKASRLAALEHIEARLGLRAADPEQAAKIAEEAEIKRKVAQAKYDRELKERQDKARKRFYAMTPIVTPEGWQGTLAETYWRARGIDVRAIPSIAGSFRFDGQAEYWADDQRPKRHFPAIVSAMVDAAGTVCANHFTFLMLDGSGKAPVERPKMMYPDVKGLVIRCTNGASGLGPEKAAKQGVTDWLFACEGIEDALTAAYGDHELRCWAMGSLSGLMNVPDHPVIKGWIIARDNDWHKPSAVAGFEAALKRIRAFGKPVEVVSANHGKDLNDELNYR